MRVRPVTSSSRRATTTNDIAGFTHAVRVQQQTVPGAERDDVDVISVAEQRREIEGRRRSGGFQFPDGAAAQQQRWRMPAGEEAKDGGVLGDLREQSGGEAFLDIAALSGVALDALLEAGGQGGQIGCVVDRFAAARAGGPTRNRLNGQLSGVNRSTMTAAGIRASDARRTTVKPRPAAGRRAARSVVHRERCGRRRFTASWQFFRSQAVAWRLTTIVPHWSHAGWPGRRRHTTTRPGPALYAAAWVHRPALVVGESLVSDHTMRRSRAMMVMAQAG